MHMHNIFCRYFWDMRVEFPKVNKYVLRNKMKYFAKWSCVWFGSMWKWNYGTNFSSNLINEWRKYLLSEASKVTWHSNLSCTCVKSLKLWIAFVPNILEKNQNTSSSLMQFIWKISQKHAILHMSAASHLAGNIGQLLDPGTLALEWVKVNCC